jgi:hypothetical protein
MTYMGFDQAQTMKDLERNLPTERIRIYNSLQTAYSKSRKVKASQSSFTPNDKSTIRMIRTKLRKRNKELSDRKRSEPLSRNSNDLSLKSDSDSEEENEGNYKDILIDSLIASGCENCFSFLQELDELKQLFDEFENAKSLSKTNANAKENMADIELDIFDKEENIWKLYFNDNSPFPFSAPKKFWPRDSVRMKLENYHKIKFWVTEKIRTFDVTFMGVQSGVVVRGKSRSLKHSIRRFGLKFDQ